MTVKELIDELKHYDGQAIVKIHIERYSISQNEVLDETFEDIEKIIFERFIDDQVDEALHIETHLYED